MDLTRLDWTGLDWSLQHERLAETTLAMAQPSPFLCPYMTVPCFVTGLYPWVAFIILCHSLSVPKNSFIFMSDSLLSAEFVTVNKRHVFREKNSCRSKCGLPQLITSKCCCSLWTHSICLLEVCIEGLRLCTVYV